MKEEVTLQGHRSWLATTASPAHLEAAEVVVNYFQQIPEAEAVLRVNSCVLSNAAQNTSLDMVVFVGPESLAQHDERLKEEWLAFYQSSSHFTALRQAGQFAGVHVDIVDGRYAPPNRTVADGADNLELEIGNHLAYSTLLWERRGFVTQLQKQWLPYYTEPMRQDRLALIQDACDYHLDQIPHYVRQELYFAAFDQLYTSFQLFMQALFIARRTYPIAYTRCIREQIEGILGLPELYRLLPGMLEIRPLRSGVVCGRAQELGTLLAIYTKNLEYHEPEPFAPSGTLYLPQ